MTKREPDPDASALAKKRWGKVTKDEKLRIGRKLTKTRIRLRKAKKKSP